MAEQNVNTTTAKGLEAAIITVSGGIIKIESKLDGIFYGAYNLSKDQAENASFIERLKDKGILNALDTIASVDLCNLANYALQQIPGGKKFNPDDPAPSDPLGRAKWTLQYKAFTIQSDIDNFYNSYGSTDNEESKLGLQKLVSRVREIFGEVLNPETQSDLNDPQLIQAFPEISLFSNYIKDSLGVFNQYTDLRTIPNSDLQKLIQKVDKIRAICIGIQGLNSPANLVAFADTFLNGKIQEELDKLSKLVNPARIVPFLRNIIQTGNSILQIMRMISGYISFGRLIIRLCVVLVKIFKRILDFLVFLGVPNVYTTLGITNKMSIVANKEIQINGIDNFVKRLNQINVFLGQLVGLVTRIIIIVQSIIDKINIVLINLENCNNIPPDIVKDLENLRNNLQSENNNLIAFRDNYESNRRAGNSRFGDFTISIVTEEVTDPIFRLKRRYGVALDNSGVVAVQSNPTYASDDTIIFNEVKQLLVAKNLIPNTYTDLSSAELNTINEALNYLEDPNINIDNLEMGGLNNGLDDPDNENEDSGLGLNAFMNKLSGGKKLRKRMRKVMAQQQAQLETDLRGMR